MRKSRRSWLIGGAAGLLAAMGSGMLAPASGQAAGLLDSITRDGHRFQVIRMENAELSDLSKVLDDIRQTFRFKIVLRYENGKWEVVQEPERGLKPRPEPKPSPQPKPRPEPAPEPEEPASPNEDVDLTQMERQLVDLINAERRKAGLQPLVVNEGLTKVARLKSQDMVDNNYFSHDSPTYGSPFDMMRAHGLNYSYAGENIGMGPTVERVHQAFMQSPGHRANVLNPNFREVGVGIVEGGPGGLMVSEEFATLR